MKMTLTSTLAIVIVPCTGLLLATPDYAAAEPEKPSALYAESSADSLQQQILSKEREELECLKTGDLKHFGELLADDAIFVDDHGPVSKARIVEHTAEFRLTEYTIDDVKFVQLSKTSDLVSYKIIEKGSSHGKEFTARVLRLRPVGGAGREDGLRLQPGNGGEMTRSEFAKRCLQANAQMRFYRCHTCSA